MKDFFVVSVLFFVVSALFFVGCKTEPPNDSDSKQRAQQESILAEATSEVGMPDIVNFRERKLLKMIYELRDQSDLTTITYLVGDDDAKLVFLCASIGYGIPYATQFTSPAKPMWDRGERNGGNITLPQADPNGLFSPAAADGTWVLCKDPNGTDVKPVFIEPRVVVSPFRLESTGNL